MYSVCDCIMTDIIFNQEDHFTNTGLTLSLTNLKVAFFTSRNRAVAILKQMTSQG